MFSVVILEALPALTQNEFDLLLPFVSTEKQARIKRFRFFSDAQNCLLGDILARIEICSATGLANNQLEFSSNEYGKPLLLNAPQIHFNISHAGHYIACVLSDVPVGIDIEIMRPFDCKIIERFFASDESAYVMGGKQLQRFYEVWTKKESRIKWEGVGLNKSLPSFSVFDQGGAEDNPVYQNVFQNNEAICHICSAKREHPEIKVIDTAVLSDMLRAYQSLQQRARAAHNNA